jgi:hypothetical protein
MAIEKRPRLKIMPPRVIIPLIEYLSSILPRKIDARVEKIKKRDKALDN